MINPFSGRIHLWSKEKMWLICILFFLFPFINSCSDDNPNEPQEDLCAIFSRSSGGHKQPAISIPCNETSHTSIYDVEYDNISRPLSCNFTASCSGKTYTGRIYNIKYDGLGQIESYDATVNGKNCHYTP